MIAWIGSALYLIICSVALIWGGKAERWVAVAMLAEFLGVNQLQTLTDPEAPHYVALALDVLVLGVLAYVAFATDRHWTLPATALQIISTVDHFCRIIDASIHSWTYVTVSIGAGYGLLACLLVGVLTAGKRPLRFWRSSDDGI